MRASSNNDHRSCCSDSNGSYGEWSSNCSDEDSHHCSDGPRSNGSWEVDSFCDSYTRGYGNYDRDYDSTSSEQSVREYMNCDPCASNEDSDNREGPGEGESPSEPAEEEATLPFPRSSCPLSSGSITALWGPRTSVRWHQQMQIVAIGTNSLFYSWAPSVGPVHALAPRCGQGNIISGSAPVKKRTFYSRS